MTDEKIKDVYIATEQVEEVMLGLNPNKASRPDRATVGASASEPPMLSSTSTGFASGAAAVMAPSKVEASSPFSVDQIESG